MTVRYEDLRKKFDEERRNREQNPLTQAAVRAVKPDLDELERIAHSVPGVHMALALRQAIARIRELEQQRAVPDGYVLVPAQPSIAMCINGAAAADNEINGHAAAQVYAAMLLAAAPATQHTETK